MKKFLTIALAAAAAIPALAADRMAPAADPEIENPDSTGFKFTDVKINRTGSVKTRTNQAHAGLSPESQRSKTM